MSILRIDISSLPTLARRVVREMPGVAFVVQQSAKEGKAVVYLDRQYTHEQRAEFEKLVHSL